MTKTNEQLLANIDKLAPEIAARAGEIEELRKIPLDLFDKLKAIGVFRMFVPESHGGLEVELPAGLEVLTMLSRLDGSLGWTAMSCNGSAIILSLMSRRTYDEVYRTGPIIVTGSGVPAGAAEVVRGGLRVNGRWPFASGCQNADWLFGVCATPQTVGAAFTTIDKGTPFVTRAFALPSSEWLIEDTWHAAGLEGTGSHHIVLTDKIVPRAKFFEFPDGTPCVEGPLYQAQRQLFPLFHGAFAVGVALGALDELLARANTGRQQLRAPTPMRDSEVFQYELGRIAADMTAAEATLRAEVSRLWSHALAGTLKNETRFAESRRAGVWLTATCSRIADACFTLDGGSAVYNSSSLQRRMRDLHVAAQHITVQSRHLAHAGKTLLCSTCL